MKKFTNLIYISFTFILAMFVLLGNGKVTAQSQNALDFDGIDDYVTTANASALVTGTEMSITMWVFPVNPVIGFPDFDGFAGIRNNLDADFYILQYSATTVEARFTNSAGQVFNIVHGGLQLSTWQHFALTYDGNMMRLYLNGLVQDSVVATGTISNTAESFYIGDLVYSGTDYYLQGKMDEVSLWNRALLPNEVNCIYHNEIDTSDAGLKLYYKFNQGIAGGSNPGVTSLIDEKNNGNGTLFNFTLNGSNSNWVTGVYSGTTVADTICQGDSYVFGSQTLTNAGVYFEHFPLASGCDSTVQLTLSVSAVDTSVSQNITTLTSGQAGAIYQWINCSTMQPIAGATSQLYTATVNGSYAVVVTFNNCTDTSACHLVNNTGVFENSIDYSSMIFSNPVHKNFTIDLAKTENNVSVFVSDVEGREIFKRNYSLLKTMKIDASEWKAGIYIVKITTHSKQEVVRVVKE